MTITRFPNGVSSFGMPVMGGGVPITLGTYFFVSSVIGNNGYDGLSPDAPLATIDAAVNKCTASKSDVIIVLPGHAENIAAATSLVLDVAGVTVFGLGAGHLRPTLTFTATASRIPISADGVTVENILCVGGVADIVSGITVTGDDVTLRRVDMRSGSATLEFLQFLDVDAAARATIEGCKIIASSTAGSNTGIRVDATDFLTIRACELRGDFTTAAISGNTGSAAASTNIAVIGCLIENLDTTAGLLIDHHDNTTGINSDVRGFTLFATAPETAFDPGATLNTEVYVVNAIDESGTIVPTTLST